MKSEIAVLLFTALQAASAADRGILADYSGVIREAKVRTDKHYHMDVPAVLAKLQALHVNTYYYLVHSEQDWNDMEIYGAK